LTSQDKEKDQRKKKYIVRRRFDFFESGGQGSHYERNRRANIINENFREDGNENKSPIKREKKKAEGLDA